MGWYSNNHSENINWTTGIDVGNNAANKVINKDLSFI